MHFNPFTCIVGLALPLILGTNSPMNQQEVNALKRRVAELEQQVSHLRTEVQNLRRELQAQAAAKDPKAEIPVAWGLSENGLQAGLALRPANKQMYQVGDTVQFVVKIRNVTDRPLEMPYLAVERDARIGPSVLDGAGKRPPMAGPVFTSIGGRAISKLTLSAGQEVEFATPELVLGPVGEPRIQPKAVILGGPGKYRVSYHVHYLNSDADQTHNSFSTGEVELNVMPARKIEE